MNGTHLYIKKLHLPWILLNGSKIERELWEWVSSLNLWPLLHLLLTPALPAAFAVALLEWAECWSWLSWLCECLCLWRWTRFRQQGFRPPITLNPNSSNGSSPPKNSRNISVGSLCLNISNIQDRITIYDNIYVRGISDWMIHHKVGVKYLFSLTWTQNVENRINCRTRRHYHHEKSDVYVYVYVCVYALVVLCRKSFSFHHLIIFHMLRI